MHLYSLGELPLSVIFSFLDVKSLGLLSQACKTSLLLCQEEYNRRDREITYGASSAQIPKCRVIRYELARDFCSMVEKESDRHVLRPGQDFCSEPQNCSYPDLHTEAMLLSAQPDFEFFCRLTCDGLNWQGFLPAFTSNPLVRINQHSAILDVVRRTHRAGLHLHIRLPEIPNPDSLLVTVVAVRRSRRAETSLVLCTRGVEGKAPAPPTSYASYRLVSPRNTGSHLVTSAGMMIPFFFEVGGEIQSLSVFHVMSF